MKKHNGKLQKDLKRNTLTQSGGWLGWVVRGKGDSPISRSWTEQCILKIIAHYNLNAERKPQYVICQPMLLWSVPSTEECSRNCSNNLWPCKLNLQSCGKWKHHCTCYKRYSLEDIKRDERVFSIQSCSPPEKGKITNNVFLGKITITTMFLVPIYSNKKIINQPKEHWLCKHAILDVSKIYPQI